MKENTVFAYKDNHKNSVYSRQHQTTGRPILTIKPNTIEENNLDFLPQCPPIE